MYFQSKGTGSKDMKHQALFVLVEWSLPVCIVFSRLCMGIGMCLYTWGSSQREVADSF
jgi:hypothetical protein